MKKLMLSALGTAALALCACGDSGRLQSVSDPDSPPPPRLSETNEGVPGRHFELRLRGDNAGAYGATLVPLREVRVTTLGGARLPSWPRARTVDLSAANHAHLVGHFFVPDEVGRVRVTLVFDDFGGWEGAAGAGAIDARVAPLTFTAPVDSLAERGRAVVHLDVGRSLLEVEGDEGRRLLVPRLSVNY
jgi:hypothetical protein